MENEIIIKRLAIIKQLFNQGVTQSKQAEPLSSFSVLSFHDAVEMFLKLYSEYKDREDSFQFLKYWDNYPELTHKEQMKSLSLRRKNLKHKGVFPSRLDIEHSLFSTREFFQESTTLIEDIQFDNISLTELVYPLEVKDLLKEAEQLIESTNYELFMEKISIAYLKLIDWYENKASDLFNTPFFFGKDFSFDNPNSLGLDDYRLSKEMKSVGKFIGKASKAFENIQAAIKVLSLGFDYKKYVKFKYLTCEASFMTGGRIHCFMPESRLKTNYPKEELEFVFNFVVECSLKLQEFEIDYSNLNFENS